MKKQLLCLIMLVFALLPIKVHAEEISINSENFPDSQLRSAISDQCDTNGNGILEADEIANAKYLDLNNRGVQTMSCIKYLTSRERLDAESNLFTSLDISNLTSLKQVVLNHCTYLTQLNVTGCSNLTTLIMMSSGIESIDVEGTPLMDMIINKLDYTGSDPYNPSIYLYGSNGDAGRSLVVPTGTTFATKVEEKAATHTSDGVKAHYALGSHYYADGACLKEITAVVIPKLEHSYDTYEVNDLTNHLKKCSCGDSIPEAHSFDSANVCTICLYKKYQILEGADTEVSKGAEEDVRIQSEGELSDFVKLEVDGSEVSSEDYTKEGNTIITLKKNYVEKLSVGDHEVNIHFKDGMSSTTLVVKETTSNTATTTQTTTTEGNETATVPIFNNITLGLGAVILVLVGIIIGLLLNRKKG